MENIDAFCGEVSGKKLPGIDCVLARNISSRNLFKFANNPYSATHQLSNWLASIYAIMEAWATVPSEGRLAYLEHLSWPGSGVSVGCWCHGVFWAQQCSWRGLPGGVRCIRVTGALIRHIFRYIVPKNTLGLLLRRRRTSSPERGDTSDPDRRAQCSVQGACS